MEWARAHGYGGRAERAAAEARAADPNQRYFHRRPARERAAARTALMGSSPTGLSATAPTGMTLTASTGGCIAQAQRTLYGDLAAWFRQGRHDEPPPRPGGAGAPRRPVRAGGRPVCGLHEGGGPACGWSGNDPDWRTCGAGNDYDMNDRASSWWNNGYSGALGDVRVYADINYGGASTCAPNGSAGNIPWEWNDRISSHKWVTDCGF
ncbi:peptidase inhibitor family I36 protein [Streptomyces sp. NPDC001373]|uniref:peptidase inhibitor family I36 protein n=1 Tax=Streptomyces sp. NPDC001373 TaxID=3364565 RepID=UPI00367539F6